MTCPGCGCFFCPPPPDTVRARPHRYCCYDCKVAHRAALHGLPVCAATGKLAYPAARDAWAGLAEVNAAPRRRPLTDVYPCPHEPGHWHNTCERRAPIRVTVRGGARDDAGGLLRQLRGW